MLAFIVLIAVLCAIVRAQEYPLVPVEVYYEALCPGCQSFITGPLTSTLAHDDIFAIIDLKMVPYGNTKTNSDGSFTCQHGTDECISDVYEQCVLYKLSGNLTSIVTGETSEAAWPYLQCMEFAEGDPSYAESCFTDNMVGSGIEWSSIASCYADEGADTQASAATATPTHDYVPWVLVDGTLLEHTNALLASVCKAYTGPTPASCKTLNTEGSVCLNL